MPPDGPASSFLELIPGGVWIALRVEAAGKSPPGRFVRRHREKLLATCIAMPGAALFSAKIEALGFLPAGAPGAFWPVVSAAIAGALSVWPRLRLEAALLVHAVGSAARFMLATIGAFTAAAVFFWDGRDPASAWTLGEAVAGLRVAAPTMLSWLFAIWVLVRAFRFVAAGGSRSGAIRHAVLAREDAARSNRELAARHEAAHALVACVLGMPMESAWINDGPDWHGIAGAVRIHPPPAARTLETSYGLLARKIAVSVAGTVGERGARPKQEIMRELRVQRDWTQATELSWFAASLRPGHVLVEQVLDAVVPALHSAPWTAAIEEGAQALLRAGSDPVPPGVFASIARRSGLALPAVDTLAATLSSPPAREIVT